MTLVVEDGTARANADSYCSIVFADTYHTGRGREESWSDLDSEVKEAALRQASDYIGQEYRLRWAGSRRTATQALDWPRVDVPMKDVPGASYSAYYPYDVVPDEVKKACAELAFRSISAALSPDLGAPVTGKTVGPISVTYAAGARQETRYRAVDDLLAPLLKSSGNVFIRLVRS